MTNFVYTLFFCHSSFISSFFTTSNTKKETWTVVNLFHFLTTSFKYTHLQYLFRQILRFMNDDLRRSHAGCCLSLSIVLVFHVCLIFLFFYDLQCCLAATCFIYAFLVSCLKSYLCVVSWLDWR